MSKKPSEDVSELLTIPELARRWKLSEGYLRHRVADGTLPVVRFGRAVRIHQAAAESFVLARQKKIK